MPDSGAAPASTRVRGCTPSRGQSCGACLERFFEPLTGAAAPAWELLRRQTCPKWTCRTNAAACVQACERGAQKSPEVGSPHAIRAGCQPPAPAGPQHERFANCERCGAEAHGPVGDARFGVQGARARRVAHRAWPRTSVWYLLAPRSPHTRPHCSPPPPGPRASRDAPCISGAAARVLEEFLRSPRANISAIGCTSVFCEHRVCAQSFLVESSTRGLREATETAGMRGMRQLRARRGRAWRGRRL